MAALISFVSGLLLAIGLGISGMTRPEKITAFLDFLGPWDPSLALVMLGATAVYFVIHLWTLKRSAPLFAPAFQLPTRRDIDRPLVLGAVLFGLGWGLVGFCPGPAIAMLVTGDPAVIIFVLSMAVGMYAFEVLDVRFSMEPDGGAGLITKD